ncbi:trypsin-like peptidase domain-containing protein [Rhizobium ruizarguesonis]
MPPNTMRLVAAIRGTDGKIKGSGCVVLGRYVITCAHVVDDASSRDRGSESPPETELNIDLPFLDLKDLPAKVVAWYPMRPLSDLAQNPLADIAVLELALQAELTGGLEPGDVDRQAQLPGTHFLTFGFPEGYDTGTSASGEILAEIPGGWLQVRDIQDYGYFIAPGFSGAPVYSNPAIEGSFDEPRLIGLAAQADQDETKRLAFVLPTQQLCRAWPSLAQPYPGLAAFEDPGADVFFGREAFIAQLEGKFDTHSLAIVVGPAGSGKSSVVLAGLAPRLRKQGWHIAVCRPLRNPLREMALGLAPLLDPDARSVDERERLADEWVERLAEDPWRILELGRGLVQRGINRTLLVIDQFEQLFTEDLTAPDGAAMRKESVTAEDGSLRQARFVKVLEAIASQEARTAGIRVVATLRSDFRSRALAIGRLAANFQLSEVELKPMTGTELTEAVCAPARAFGVGFEAGLAEEIVGEMKSRPGGLPILQLALAKLWRQQRGRCLSWEAYRNSNGESALETALNEHAEAVLESLRQDRFFGVDAESRVRRVMLRLVQLGDGDGVRDIPVASSRTEIGEEDWPVVERLAEARLILIGHEAVKGCETAEMAQEKLIDNWDRLRGWLDADRPFGLWRQNLNVDLERWAGTRREALLRGSMLAEAIGWLSSHRKQLSERERLFVEASQANAEAEADQELHDAQERERLAKDVADAREQVLEIEGNARDKQKFSNRALAGIVALLALAIATGIILSSTKKVDTSVTDAASREAKGRRLAAQAESLQRNATDAESLELAAALSVEAWRRFPTFEAARAMSRALIYLPVLQSQSPNEVDIMAITADHNSLVSAGNAGDARMTRISDGKTIADLPGGNSEVIALSFDGSVLAAGSSGGRTRVTHIADQKELAVLQDKFPVTALALNSNGSALAIGHADGSLRLIRTADQGNIASFQDEYQRGIKSVTFSPDGVLFAVAWEDGSVSLFRGEDGSGETQLPNESPVVSVNFSTDHALLALGDEKGLTRLIRTADGKQLGSVQQGGWVNAVAFSRHGTYLGVGSDDGSAKIIHTLPFAELVSIKHEGRVTAVEFSPNEEQFATGSYDNSVRLTRTADGKESLRIAQGGPVSRLAFSDDGAHLAVGGQNRLIKLFSVVDDSKLATVLHRKEGAKVALSSDGSLFAGPSAENQLQIVHVSGGSVVPVEDNNDVSDVVFSPDSNILATATNVFTGAAINTQFATKDGAYIISLQYNATVGPLALSRDPSRLATVINRTSIRLSPPTDGIGVTDGTIDCKCSTIHAIALSADADRIAIGTDGNRTQLMNAKDGSELQTFYHDGPVTAVAFSPDGTVIASGDESGGLWLNRSADGSEIGRIEFSGSIEALAFNADGSLLAAGSKSGAVGIVSTSDGVELARTVRGDQVNAIAFGPNGLVINTGKETLEFWTWLTPSQVLAKLCDGRAGRNLSSEEWSRYVDSKESWVATCPNWRS